MCERSFLAKEHCEGKKQMKTWGVREFHGIPGLLSSLEKSRDNIITHPDCPH